MQFNATTHSAFPRCPEGVRTSYNTHLMNTNTKKKNLLTSICTHTHTHAPSCTLICPLNFMCSWLAKHQTADYFIWPIYLSIYLSTNTFPPTTYYICNYFPALPDCPFSLPLYFPSPNLTYLLVSLLYLPTDLNLDTHQPTYVPH